MIRQAVIRMLSMASIEGDRARLTLSETIDQFERMLLELATEGDDA